MGRYREKILTFFVRLTHGLGRKRCSVIAPVSKSLGSPAPQTCLIFELPDELILSILSHISPDPRLTSQYARFCIPYSAGISDCYNKRVAFLRPLSMTCKAMRLRFLPWVWERLELSPLRSCFPVGDTLAMKFNIVVDILHTDLFLAASVRFMKVHLLPHGPTLPSFVKCLESLPGLHTVEIGLADDAMSASLKNALKRVKLPQIKTLIIPPAAHPLLRHCRNVEDVVCVVKDKTTTSDEFIGSLASNRNSKVKRLAIPLALWDNPSRFVAACPRLTELTVYPYLHNPRVNMGLGIPQDLTEGARSAVSELVVACKALPDFDTLQILYFPTEPPRPICWCGTHGPSKEQWDRSLREQVDSMKDLVLGCLKSPKMGHQEGKGRKKTTVRVIRFGPVRPRPNHHPGPMKVEQYEV